MSDKSQCPPVYPIHPDMTLRDFIAFAVLMEHVKTALYNGPDYMSNSAYDVADAMMKRREGK